MTSYGFADSQARKDEDDQGGESLEMPTLSFVAEADELKQIASTLTTCSSSVEAVKLVDKFVKIVC